MEENHPFPGGVVKKKKRSSRQKAGIIREIRRQQSVHANQIPRLPFQRLVREIGQEHGDHRWEANAIDLLRDVTARHISFDVIGGANMVKNTLSNRQGLCVKDIHAALMLDDKWKRFYATYLEEVDRKRFEDKKEAARKDALLLVEKRRERWENAVRRKVEKEERAQTCKEPLVRESNHVEARPTQMPTSHPKKKQKKDMKNKKRKRDEKEKKHAPAEDAPRRRKIHRKNVHSSKGFNFVL